VGPLSANLVRILEGEAKAIGFDLGWVTVFIMRVLLGLSAFSFN